MNCVERVKAICKERKIPLSKLEKDLGFGNGYIGQLRKGTFPTDRLMLIAEYLSVDPTYLISGEDAKENAPAVSGERTASDDEIKFALFGGDGDITDAMYDEVRQFAAFVKQREANKKKE